MNIFKLLGSLGNMSKIQQEIQTVTAQIGDLRFQGDAGGGMVVATVSGSGTVLSCAIDEKLLVPQEKDLLEDLVIGAVNAALAKAKAESAEIVQRKLAETLDMPELATMMSQFLPKP